MVGPILVNGERHYIPMATTEGALIASTNRGSRAITESGGVTSVVVEDGMTRAPVFKCESVLQAAKVKQFVESPEGFSLVFNAFSQTTKHGKLEVFSFEFSEIIVHQVFCERKPTSHASESQRRRRDGHEHAHERLQQSRRCASQPLPHTQSGIAQRKSLHGQEAFRDQLAAGPRQVGDLRSPHPRADHAQRAEMPRSRYRAAQYREEPRGVEFSGDAGRKQRARSEYRRRDLSGDGTGHGAGRGVVALLGLHGRRRGRGGTGENAVHVGDDAVDRGGNHRGRDGTRSAARLHRVDERMNVWRE